MDKELITLKGTGDGVKIYLSPTAEMSEITRALHDKLGEFRRFFGAGHCNIYFIGREFTKSDMTRLNSVAKTMLPESTVNFGERKRVRPQMPEPEEKKEDAKNAGKPTIPVDEIREVVTHNFKSSRARFFEGAVKSGRTVESDGHLILVGDVFEGGKLAAVGNIIVLGRLEGEAEAGCMGNSNAYVIAGVLGGGRIKIAGCSRIAEGFSVPAGKQFVKAFLINNEIFFDDFLLKQ